MIAAALASLVLGATISVPLDYAHPSLGSTPIYYEFGAPFDAHKPTLFVIADGQQFLIRKGRMASVQERYGPEFNVVGIVGRADNPALVKACKDTNGKVNWERAWQFYNSGQWIEDIERVRRRVLGSGKVLLEGASGGAMMVHQYLSRYARNVARAFTAASVAPWLEPLFPRGTATFWSSLSPEHQRRLTALLDAHPQDRRHLVVTFQRQHYFVSAEELKSAREKLIDDLTNDYSGTLKKAGKDYQVDAMEEIERSDAALPIAVREYEFVQSAGRTELPEEFDPEFEAEYQLAEPLLKLWKAGKVGTAPMDLEALHRAPSEVLVLAGTEDRAVNYLTSISLAARYPKGQLVLVHDSHTFSNLNEHHVLRPLEHAFLLHGFEARDYTSALAAVLAFR